MMVTIKIPQLAPKGEGEEMVHIGKRRERDSLTY
jgi:hypothetical protein